MNPKIDTEKTGKNIKRLMNQSGITPKDIRDWCGFSSVTPIYFWMQGRNLPTVDNLIILAHIFHCKIDDIIVIE